MTPLALAFTKGEGRSHTLVMLRANGESETIACPEQGIVPHDMVHHAVESALAAQGFLGRIAAGEARAFTIAPAGESDGVERLVEVIQGDTWSGGATPPDDMIDLYRVTCEARTCPALTIDAGAIEAIRHRLAELSLAWDTMPVGGTLMLRFEI